MKQFLKSPGPSTVLKGHDFNRAEKATEKTLICHPERNRMKLISTCHPERNRAKRGAVEGSAVAFLSRTRTIAAMALFLCSITALYAQQPLLPNAPQPQLIAQATPAPSQPAAPTGPKLTLADAERMAIEHNPNVTIAHLLQLAQAQVVREARSAELPDAVGSLTAVGSHQNTRITAGALNNSSVFDRAAGGLTLG